MIRSDNYAQLLPFPFSYFRRGDDLNELLPDDLKEDLPDDTLGLADDLKEGPVDTLGLPDDLKEGPDDVLEPPDLEEGFDDILELLDDLLGDATLGLAGDLGEDLLEDCFSEILELLFF